MTSIKISSENDGSTAISNFFIDYYMVDANGDFVKLYLFLARLCSSGRSMTVEDIADSLNCTEKDVCRGIRYWIREDALKLSYDDDNNITGIIMLDLKAPESDQIIKLNVLDFKSGRADDSSAEAAPKEEDAEVSKAPRKKSPTPETLSSMLEDPNISDLVSEANAYCNRTIAQKDIASIIYIYDQLSFSFDLCEFLLEYCASVGKTNFNYIEAVARNWYENGITTREDAENYSVKYFTIYSRIMKQLGITTRTFPAPAEREFIDVWVNEYGFSDSIIIEACRRAVLNSPNSANFQYVNGILSSWYASHVKSFSDILALDEAHKKKKSDSSGKKSTTSGNDFNQTDMSDALTEIENLYMSGVKVQ